MKVNELVFVQGMDDTRRALARWNRSPRTVLVPWTLVSLAVAVGLLAGVWAIAELSRPDPTRLHVPGLHGSADLEDYAQILYRNGLVLALHGLACVAGFMAGSSVPLSASKRTGLSRWAYEKAGPLAIAFVACATLFSLATQAHALGVTASTLALQLGVSPGVLLLGLSAHALPELVALFLPLAAWLVASRAGAWAELLAATAVTVAIAVPVLLASAAVELWVSPRLLAGLAA